MNVSEHGYILCPMDADGKHYAKCDVTCQNWTACQCERMAARESVSMDGVYALVEAFIQRIRSDWMSDYESKKQLTKYILSDDFYEMTGLDGVSVLKHLIADYEKQERERKSMVVLRRLGAQWRDDLLSRLGRMMLTVALRRLASEDPDEFQTVLTLADGLNVNVMPWMIGGKQYAASIPVGCGSGEGTEDGREQAAAQPDRELDDADRQHPDRLGGEAGHDPANAGAAAARPRDADGHGASGSAAVDRSQPGADAGGDLT